MNGPTKVQFEKIFQTGKIIQSPPFRLIYIPGSGKIGIATTKSLGSKPRRNFVKRRVREVIRMNNYLLTSDTDYVVMVRESAYKMNFSDLKSRFATLFELKSNKMKEEQG